MTKKQSEKTIAILTESKIQLAITLAGVVVVLAGVFITSRLAPLSKDISLNTQRIEAIEDQTEHYIPRVEIETRLDNIIIQLDRIEDKLGR